MSDAFDTAIGGAIGIAGTVVAQWFGLFSSKTERRRRFAEQQRERLEKISGYIAEGMAWRDSFHTLPSFDTVRDSRPSRIVRPATMLARIHFPDLIPHAAAFQECLSQFQVFGMMSYKDNYKDETPVGVRMNLHDRDKMFEFGRRLNSLVDAFDQAIEKEARKYDPSAS